MSSSDPWSYWTPQTRGDCPDDLRPNEAFPAGWKVQFKTPAGCEWHDLKAASFIEGWSYRFQRPVPQSPCVGLMCQDSHCPDCYPRNPPPLGVAPDYIREPHLPEGLEDRNSYPMAEGLLDYFPNALAEVSRLSHQATLQHHPDAGMHWDRTKSLDHRNKIMRHLVDTHTVDDKGIDHWAMVCWRALAGYQEYLEAKHGLPPSRASRNRPETFGSR